MEVDVRKKLSRRKFDKDESDHSEGKCENLLCVALWEKAKKSVSPNPPPPRTKKIPSVMSSNVATGDCAGHVQQRMGARKVLC